MDVQYYSGLTLFLLRLSCLFWFFLYVGFLFIPGRKQAKEDTVTKMNDPKIHKVYKIFAFLFFGNIIIYPFKSLLVMSIVALILFYPIFV